MKLGRTELASDRLVVLVEGALSNCQLKVSEEVGAPAAAPVRTATPVAEGERLEPLPSKRKVLPTSTFCEIPAFALGADREGIMKLAADW